MSHYPFGLYILEIPVYLVQPKKQKGTTLVINQTIIILMHHICLKTKSSYSNVAKFFKLLFSSVKIITLVIIMTKSKKCEQSLTLCDFGIGRMH